MIGIDGKVIFVKHGRLYITCSPTRLIKANKVFQKQGGVIDQLGPVIYGKEEFESKSIEGATLTEKRDSSSDEEERVVARQNVAVEAPVGNDADRAGQFENDDRAVGGLEGPRNVSQGRSKSKYPKANDKISCLLGEGDQAEWFNVEVIKKGGKATARNKDYFNVKYSDNSTGGIHLDKVPWRYQPSVNRLGDGDEQTATGDSDRADEVGEGVQQLPTEEDGDIHQELPASKEETD